MAAAAELGWCAAQGFVGLSRAIDKYSLDRGFKFCTYASWWIRQSISRCITERSRVVRLPVHIYEAAAKVKRVRDELQVRLGADSLAPFKGGSRQVAMRGARCGLPCARQGSGKARLHLPPSAREQGMY